MSELEKYESKEITVYDCNKEIKELRRKIFNTNGFEAGLPALSVVPGMATGQFLAIEYLGTTGFLHDMFTMVPCMLTGTAIFGGISMLLSYTISANITNRQYSKEIKKLKKIRTNLVKKEAGQLSLESKVQGELSEVEKGGLSKYE